MVQVFHTKLGATNIFQGICNFSIQFSDYDTVRSLPEIVHYTIKFWLCLEVQTMCSVHELR